MYPNQDDFSFRQDDIAIQVATATPHQLILILFSGLMDELVRAKSHIVAKRYERKAQSIDKCINILNGLAGALNFEKGGGLTADLAELYDYCVGQLYNASHQLSIKMIEEVEQLMSTIRKGWEGLGSKSQQNG